MKIGNRIANQTQPQLWCFDQISFSMSCKRQNQAIFMHTVVRFACRIQVVGSVRQCKTQFIHVYYCIIMQYYTMYMLLPVFRRAGIVCEHEALVLRTTCDSKAAALRFHNAAKLYLQWRVVMQKGRLKLKNAAIFSKILQIPCKHHETSCNMKRSSKCRRGHAK